ncbi:multiple organellar RNA editing factor 7, mitochondrial [Salvia miltiorrhiza]|uniref:multiple organellar RNA editing factor 7, mitochondrial n=1 Tax=Salvia miltiorrhiza TaxID=226208 RepID=UPI0025ABA887|nr:multiple organellar RNA editing factor 7, mitochondrial [Salvia miltiorrhiza]
MLRKVLLAPPSNLTAAVNLLSFSRRSDSALHCSIRRFSSDSPTQTRVTELPRVDALVDGCDYKHWLVVMQPPDNYPQREEIIHQYVATLAVALGSEKAAKESIYSVSTKYYYAFSCKLEENVTHKITCLPRVKWILPDSYLCDEEDGYGGEPFIDGKVVPYEEKYHTDWLRDAHVGEDMDRPRSRKPRRRRRRTKGNEE